MNKKPYVRPVLMHESFELAEHIAACSFKLNSKSEKECSGEHPVLGDVFTTELVPTCIYDGEPDGVRFCYTTSTGKGLPVLINS